MKKFVTAAIASALTLNLIVQVSALENDDDWEVGRTCSWSPIILDEIVDGFGDCARCRTDFKFTQTILDELIDTGCEFTVEHSSTESLPISVRDQFSDFPNPIYDTDDDNGDGYYEESEVTVLSDEIVVGKEYYFATWSSKPETTTSGAFDAIFQLSKKAIFGSEYNARASDYIGSYGWTYPPTRSLHNATMSLYDECNMSTDIEEKTLKILQIPDIGDVSELMEYKDSISSEYMSVVNANSYNLYTPSENGVRKDAKAVITFNTPITLDYLNTLISNTGSTLISYEAKLTSKLESWITMCSNNTDFESVLKNANEFIADMGDTNLEFCGITSAEVIIMVNSDAYNTWCQDDKVYLVDMSDYIIKTVNNNYDIDVVVSDCYYYLEKLNMTK